jgi:hypothetical protein
MIKRGDLAPSIQVTLTDKDVATGVETPAVLAGKTVKFVMREIVNTDGVESNGRLIVNNRDAVVVDELTAKVQYDWDVGETDIAGEFRCEFTVLSAGRPSTYPTKSYISILIVESLD